MLAAVLLPFCLKLAPGALAEPVVLLPMLALFLILRVWNPALASLAAIIVALVLAFLTGATAPLSLDPTLPRPVLILPDVHLAALIGLGLPLYLVTMAGQNLPGFATLRAHGYEPPVAPALVATGGMSALAALFGAHTFNMAAITAAICLGPDTHPTATGAGSWAWSMARSGCALGFCRPSCCRCLPSAAGDPERDRGPCPAGRPDRGAWQRFTPTQTRFPAAVTLAVGASGITAFGVGGAFWA